MPSESKEVFLHEDFNTQDDSSYAGSMISHDDGEEPSEPEASFLSERSDTEDHSSYAGSIWSRDDGEEDDFRLGDWHTEDAQPLRS